MERNEEIIKAAIEVVEVAEVTAKMGMHPDFVGCTLEYVTTILTMDDERFKGMDAQDMRWMLFEEFAKRPDVHRLQKDGQSRQGTRWSTVPYETFKEIYKPKAWLL